jgi:hypothetical protein
MGYVVSSVDKSESGPTAHRLSVGEGGVGDGEVAYDAVMCWEWEGGALAPTQADRCTRPSVDASRPLPVADSLEATVTIDTNKPLASMPT